MIIDAGGGTVDFSTYSFESAAPIEISELAAPAGKYYIHFVHTFS